jgi:O-antigen/teichoic acid export membrane protein
MILSTLYEVGLYGPAAFASLTFFILLGSLDQALMPITSRVFGKHGTAYFKYSAVQASRFLLLFYFPLGFAIAASSPTLVVLVMGERFIESGLPMFITVVATTLISPGIIANNLLRSAGYTGIALKAGAIALLGQMLISLILIPVFGTIGASAARLLAYLGFMVPLIYKLNSIGGFDYDKRAVTYGLIISGVITLEIIIVNIVFPGPFSLLLQYTIAFLSYLFILSCARLLNQNDVELIDRTFRGKIKWLTGPLAKLLIRES